MTIHFACATCKTPNQAEDRLAGRTLKCFTCGSLFVVPPAPVAVAPPPAPVAVMAPMDPAAPVAAFLPEPTAPEPVAAAAFELEEEGDLFAAEAPAAPAAANFEEDLDIASLVDDEPAVVEEAAPEAAYDFSEPALEIEALDVFEEEPQPKKKKR